MNNGSDNWNVINWLFVLIFVSLGILNIIYVHFIPGLIYLIISLVYLPLTNSFLKNKVGFSIPIFVKIFLAVLVLWFTLGVGDLMEMFEYWMNK